MKKLKLLVSWLFISVLVFGQTQPLSLATNLPKSKTSITKSTPVLNTPALNMQMLLVEDAQSDKNGQLFRVGKAIPVNQDLITFGDWKTLSDGSRKMIMIIKSARAEALFTRI